MLIKEFNKDIVNNFYGYFVLQHIGKNSDEINIFVKKLNENKIYEDKFNAFRLPDLNILICFQSNLDLLSFNNLVATDGESEEIINLQVFERIRRYYDMPKNNKVGGFLFYNSIPVWDPIRCHNEKYGPETFSKNNEEPIPLINYAEDLYIYEPILSINSVGHMLYAHSAADEEWLMNEDPFPRMARTLQENLKQIVEWGDVNNNPWNNNEEISLKAVQFMDMLKFSEEFKSHIRNTQPNMQVFKYLNGDPNARVRPENTGDLTQEIKTEILKRVSHCSLSNILRIFNVQIPEDEMLYIKEKEIELVQKVQSNLLKSTDNTIEKINDSNIDYVKNVLKQNLPESYGLFNIFAEVYSNHMSILEEII